jgi:hypothetical protein
MPTPTPTPTPTATPTQPAFTTADPYDRSRELLCQELVGVEMLLDAGKRAAAASALRSLLNRTSPELAAEITERAALQELARAMAWVEPRREDVRFVPASRVTTRRGRRRPADPRRGERDAAAAAYLSEQSPVPVEESGWDEPVWGGIDYDLAALTDLRGIPCLSCKLERTRADLAHRDGLCTDCRDSGLTRESVIQRYCAVVAAGPHPVQLLRRAWKKADRPTDKAVIAAWATANLPTPAGDPTG